MLKEAGMDSSLWSNLSMGEGNNKLVWAIHPLKLK